MTRNQLRRRIRALQGEERGFTIVEVVIAMGILLSSLTVLASTALIGFRGAQIARHRQAATALADRIVEEVRGLPFSVIAQGLKDSDLAGDTSIVACSGGVSKFGSCSGETIVHSSGASTAPLYPHTGSVGTAQGFPSTLSWALYETTAAGSTGIYRLTVKVSWSVPGSAGSLQTQTLLSQPQGTGESSTDTVGGGSTASFIGSASISSGNVIITPNGAVYNGIGVTGLTSSAWNTSDSLTQSMYALDAELQQGQVTKTNGQSTLTAAQKTISGTPTVVGGATTFSTADDDATTAIGTTSAPTAITQSGPSVTLSGGNNSLGLNQYTGCSGTITRRGSSANSANNVAGISLSLPSGTVSGDVLVAQVGIDSIGTITAPSGWTAIGSPGTNGSSVKSSLFYKVAGSSEPSNYAFSTPSGSYNVGGIVSYACVDPITPVNVSATGTGTGASPVAPTVTTTVPRTFLLTFWTGGRDFTATAAGMTQQWTRSSGTGNGLGNNAKVGGAAADLTLASAGASGTKSATMSNSAAWVGQTIALKPATPGTPGTETGQTVSTTQAQSGTPCGSPTQVGLACAYATQSYVASSQAFLQTLVDLAGSGLGTCPLYAFNPPSTNPTSYAYGHRAATTGDGKVAEDVKRYYGTHTFGMLCGGTGSTPASWPGYFVKYDAGNTACQATAEAGVSAAAPSKTTAGTISVWNGLGVSSFAVPTNGTPWTTPATTLAFTTSTGYIYNISAKTGSSISSLSSGASFIAQTGTGEAKAVVGAPVTGTITYKLTDPSAHVLIDVTITIDLGTLTSHATYTAAAT